MIRVATIQDTDFIYELIKTVGSIHAEARPDLFISKAITADREKVIKRITEDKYHVLVDEESGVTVAVIMAYIRTIEDDIKYKKAKVLRIEDVVVKSEYQCMGIATNLVSGMKEYAVVNKCNRIEVNVWGFNAKSRALWISQGFTKQQETMEYSLASEKENDIINYYNDVRNEANRYETRYKKIEIDNTVKHILEECNKYNSKQIRVLDCAAGNGFYDFELMKHNFTVVASDISPSNVEYIKKKCAADNVCMNVYEENAVNLSRFSDSEFDVVLNMGPAYHLNKEDIVQCIKECLRVLKCEGKVLVSYMNKNFWGPYILKHKNEEYSLDSIMEFMNSGHFSNSSGDFVSSAYFYTPSEIADVVGSIDNAEVESHFTLDSNWGIAYDIIDKMNESEISSLRDYIYETSHSCEQVSCGKNNMLVLRKTK